MTEKRDAVVQGAHQAVGQVKEIGRLARSDDPRHWRALAACTLAIVATAIDPPILQATSSGVQGALHLAPEAAATVVGLYYVLQAGFMAAGGVLGDLYGLRRVLLIGLAVLIVTSAVTALAGSVPVLLGGHAGLSLASAIVMPLSLACLMRTFDQRVMPVAIAVYLMLQLLASLAGPTMAQVLFDRFGFGATLVPSLLVAVIALPAVRRWVEPLPTGTRLSRVDALSLLLWAAGMLTLVYALVAFAGGWGEAKDLAVLVGIGCLAAAGVRVARGSTRLRMPQVPFRVLGITLVTGAIIGLTQSGTLLQLSSFLKGVLDYGELGSGVALAPFALGTVVAALVTGVALARRYRSGAIDLRLFRKPMVAGLLAVALADLLFATLDPGTGYPLIGIALAFLGVGAAVANVPRTDLLFRSVRDDRVGVAAGLNGSSFLLGEALGNIAVTAMIALTAAAGWQATMVSAGMSEEAAADAWATGQRALFLHTAHPFLQPSFLDVVRDLPGWSAAFTQGFTSAMVVLAVVALAGALIAFLGLRRLHLGEAAAPRALSGETADTRGGIGASR
jgi:DHA2 family multidrug resistance protein-like MFS transporter